MEPTDLDSELWEHQGRRLTVGGLRQALRDLDDATPVTAWLIGPQRSTASEGLVVEIGLIAGSSGSQELAITVNDAE